MQGAQRRYADNGRIVSDMRIWKCCLSTILTPNVGKFEQVGGTTWGAGSAQPDSAVVVFADRHTLGSRLSELPDRNAHLRAVRHELVALVTGDDVLWTDAETSQVANGVCGNTNSTEIHGCSRDGRPSTSSKSTVSMKPIAEQSPKRAIKSA